MLPDGGIVVIGVLHSSGKRELCQKDVENLSGNLDTLLDGMVEFGTYICINNDILAILSSDDAQASTGIRSCGFMRRRCGHCRI